MLQLSSECRTSLELVERLADLVEEKQSTDVWWREGVEEILDEKVR